MQDDKIKELEEIREFLNYVHKGTEASVDVLEKNQKMLLLHAKVLENTLEQIARAIKLIDSLEEPDEFEGFSISSTVH